MRRLFLVIPILLLLSSCNFPLFHSNPSSDFISTSVAQTVQAAQSVTSAQPTQTAIPLGLATVGLTPTFTLTPTTSPQDPKLALGTPTYADTFSSGSAFGLTSPVSDDAAMMSVQNGSLVMQSLRAGGGYRWRLSYLTPKNYYLEGTFKTISCTGSDFYGLVLRATSYSDGPGYYFGVSCSGQYFLMRWKGTEKATLIDWTDESAIKTGSGQENRLGVMMKDNQISLYINGQFVKELDDDGLQNAGYFGVFITAQENPSMTIEVEEIDEWNQP